MTWSHSKTKISIFSYQVKEFFHSYTPGSFHQDHIAWTHKTFQSFRKRLKIAILFSRLLRLLKRIVNGHCLISNHEQMIDILGCKMAHFLMDAIVLGAHINHHSQNSNALSPHFWIRYVR